MVPSRPEGAPLGPARDGTTHHNTIVMKETTGGLVEITQGLAGGGDRDLHCVETGRMWVVEIGRQTNVRNKDR